MNMNIGQLTAHELLELCLKAHVLGSEPNEAVMITEQELPLWKTFGDVVVITDITKDMVIKGIQITHYNYQIAVNDKYQGDAGAMLISCLYNEFLPLYYLDHHYLYVKNFKKNEEDVIEVPLIEQPFNADEQSNKAVVHE